MDSKIKPKIKNKMILISPVAFDKIAKLKTKSEENGIPKSVCAVASEIILNAKM